MPSKTQNPRNALANYEPIILSTPELLKHYWPATAPLIQRCIEKAMHGEVTLDDIKTQAARQAAYIMVLKSDKFEKPEVKFVLVMELIHYPQYATMNVMAIGGSNLKMLMKRYWEFVCGWAYMSGVRTMECSVSPGMERILQSVGFNRSYIRMRHTLGTKP